MNLHVSVYDCCDHFVSFIIQIFREIVVAGFDSSAYETQQIFYSSKDGTKVPMFIVHKKVCLSPSCV